MIVHQFVLEGYESNCFVVLCSETGEALLIDPGRFDEEAADFLSAKSRRFKGIFITHGHGDHTAGVEAFLARFGGEVFSGAGLPPARPGRRIAHGEPFSLGNLAGRFLHTPGHTDDSYCLQLPGAVFTGDALFAGSIGGTSSAAEKAGLVRVLEQRILSLPDETILYPGHGPPTTVRIETTASPFFSQSRRMGR